MELSDAIKTVEALHGERVGWGHTDEAEALALVLEAAKRPGFTVKELETLQGFAATANSRWEWDEEETALVAKLDAYLEGLRGQSE